MQTMYLATYTYRQESLFDSPVFWVIAVGIMVLAAVAMLVTRLAHGTRMKEAKKALAERDYAKALELFRDIAKQRFGMDGSAEFKVKASAPCVFDHALDGVQRAYDGAGIEVDLGPLKELRADLQRLYANAKYQSAMFGHTADHNLTDEGVNIKQRIIAASEAAFAALPQVGQNRSTDRRV